MAGPQSITQETENAVGRSRPNRRLRRRVLGGALLLVTLIWCAPYLVASTQLRNQLLPWLVPEFPGELRIGAARLSWLGPVELRDVVIRDANGELVAQIPLLKSDKSLLDAASNGRDVGTFHVHNPQLRVVLTETGSNLDRLLQPFLQPPEDPRQLESSLQVGFGLEIVDGRVEITDLLTGQNSSVENLTLSLLLPATAPDPWVLQLSAVAISGDRRGSLSANFTWHQPRQLSASDLGTGELRLAAEHFPLATVQPLWLRIRSDLRLSGDLQTDLTCSWKPEASGPALSAKGELALTTADCALPSVFGADRLRSDFVSARLDVLIEDQQLRVHQLNLDSDLGSCEVRGQAALAELLSPHLASALVDPASTHEFQVAGNLDLATIAAQLPRTLRLRAGTTISQGQLQINAVSAREQGLRRLAGSLRTDQLAAVSDGRTWEWDRPLRVAWEAISDARDIEVRQLLCESDFLQLTVQGRLNEGQLRCTGDLDQLANQLSQYCDLGSWQLAGRVRAGASWQRTEDEICRVQGQIEIEQLTVGNNPARLWQEQQLKVTAQAQGRVTVDGPQQIDVGQLTLESGDDYFQAQLIDSVNHPLADTQWPLNCRLQGRLETWLARLRPWLALDDWDIHGRISAAAQGRVNGQRVELNPFHAELEQLQVVGSELFISEPMVRVEGEAQWDGGLARVTAPLLTVTSSALAVRVDRAQLMTQPSEFSAVGDIAFRGDLQRVWAWTQDPRGPLTQQTAGQFQGQVRLVTEQNVVRFDGTSTVTDLIYFQRHTVPHSHGPLPVRGNEEWKPIWQEATVRLATQGSFDHVEDVLEFDQAQLVGDAVQLVATGKISQLTSHPLADLRGEVDYDLQGLTQKLRGPIGPRVRVRGRQKHPFVVRGPLTVDSIVIDPRTRSASAGQLSATAESRDQGGNPRLTGRADTGSPPLVSPQLKAEAGIGWDALEAYGITVGPQQITMRLEDGVVWASPIDTTLSQGRLRLASRVDLQAEPITLFVETGTVAEGVRITPQICDDWLKYVAPLVAGATTAEGQFSLSLSDARIPLADPAAATIAGRVTIDGARVQPGPLAQQLLGIAREVSTVVNRNSSALSLLESQNSLLEIRPQSVDFQMVQGRVYHRNLELVVGDVTLRSQGWVGADQSLGLLAEIPIQDQWVQGKKLLAGWQGQSLQIPVQGTITQPQVDRRVVAQLSQQLIGNTAERFLQEELEKGLQKLLGPK